MNYYPRHVGDFIRDTVGLTMLEEGAYNRLLKGGLFLAVECKSAKGKETADQAAFGQAVAKDGGMYVVARSVDDVMAALG